MSTPGRPKGDIHRAQHEDAPASPPQPLRRRGSASPAPQLSLFDAAPDVADHEMPVVEVPAPEPLPPLDAAGLITELARWADAGWLRLLDLALARFIHEQAPGSAPQVLLAAALLAQLEGRGHTCLDLADLFRDAPGDPAAARRAERLNWPPAALLALEQAIARLPAFDGEAQAASGSAQANEELAAASPLSAEPTSWADWPRALQASAAVDLDVGGDVGVDHGGQPAHHRVTAGQGCAPLVWVPAGGRLYLRRYWRDEQRVAAQVLQRVAAASDPEPLAALPAGSAVSPSADHAAEVREWLERLFVTPGVASPDPDWQRVACAVACQGRLGLITGGPGTGKTYTVARLLVLLEALHRGPAPLRIALAAPTGKAAARLKQSIEAALGPLQARVGEALDLQALITRIGAARTLHSLLGARPDTRRLARHAGHPLDVDVLVVDEASMVHLEMMAALLEALPAHARLVLLGDKDQLASVEAGAVLGDLCRQAEAGLYSAATAARVLARTGQALPADLQVAAGQTAPALAQQTVMLRISQRFGGPIGQLARAVNAGQAALAWQVLRGADPSAQWLQTAPPAPAGTAAVAALALHGRPGAPGGYRAYAELLAAGPQEGALADADAQHNCWVKAVLRAFERFRLLTAVREGDWGVSGLNRTVEAALVGADLLNRSGEWFEGRPVMVTRNDASQGVFNGDVGLALRASPSARAASGGARGLRVYFLDGDQLRSVLASRLTQVETAFAMTVHKSQGSEFEHTVLVLPPRGAQVLTRELVYTGITRARKAFTLVAPDPTLLDAALARRTHRASGLPALLGTADAPAQRP